MATLEELESRIARMEKQSSLRFFIQYLLSPFLIVAVGAFINWRIEAARSEDRQLELAQQAVAKLFEGHADEALAHQRLIREMVRQELALKLDTIFAEFLSRKVDAKLAQGEVDSAEAIVAAAESIASPAAQQIVKSIDSDTMTRKAISLYRSKTEVAAAEEREGFEHLLNERYQEAVDAFKAAEAAYKSYHSVYELARYIQTNRARLESADTRQDALREILSRYSYGVPDDIIRKLSAAAGTDSRPQLQLPSRDLRPLSRPGG
jgi:hypothetical protein